MRAGYNEGWATERETQRWGGHSERGHSGRWATLSGGRCLEASLADTLSKYLTIYLNKINNTTLIYILIVKLK